MKPTVQLRYEISDHVREAQTDEDGLRQIVLNLLSNAIRFTEWRGRGSCLSLEKQPPSEERLVILVADTGVGIVAEKLGRIFDEFEQLESNHQQKGTGLGFQLPNDGPNCWADRSQSRANSPKDRHSPLPFRLFTNVSETSRQKAAAYETHSDCRRHRLQP